MAMVAAPKLYGMMKMSNKWIKDMFTKPPKDDSKSTKEDIFAPNEPDWDEIWTAKQEAKLEELYHKTAKQYSTGAFGELTKKQQDSDYYQGKQWDSSPSYDIETPTVDLKFKGISLQCDPKTDPETIYLKQLKKVEDYKKMQAKKEAYFKTFYWTPNDSTFTVGGGEPTLGLPVVWTFSSAKNVITVCQVSSAQFGYHVCLGGSVLNKMESTKDLDLYFLPMSNCQVKEDPAGLLNWIHMNLGVVESINDSYPGKELPFILKGKLKYNGNPAQRIDVFILGTAEQASLVKLESAVEIDLSEDNVDHLKKGTPTEEWDIPF